MISHPTDRNEALLQDPPTFQKRKILRKMVSRITKGINADDWNYYRLIPSSLNTSVARECRAIRFAGCNLSAITQPTAIQSETNPFSKVAGGIYFRQTSYSPSQRLEIGEYLTWDGESFSVFAAEQFQSIYEHR
jgi:hypothetical protein